MDGIGDHLQELAVSNKYAENETGLFIKQYLFKIFLPPGMFDEAHCRTDEMQL